MQLTPIIAIHLAAALAATALGPIALWARKGRTQRPRLHRAAGYAWVTLMVATAVSAIFISGGNGPRWGSFGLIHLLIPLTLGMLVVSFVLLARRNIVGHRQTMQYIYVGACVVAGGFTLLPNRLLGHSLWTALGMA
ncbi:MAG: DUF2306 domain-containing protein [Gammaproteobacteria bacterium]|jgi:uncharacterized membrane protein|nr:DUF2306 domain-containing protein [Gammaproteobacteria bacterium]MBU1508129.1 DUF2306 domain-containing protein [Gammaproteobacteria bacterium]MBU2120692.1 DUF2306 domain-containing protein [Gammaproteobacteria bacterium]MBU2169471.1 DUF2306 domain-containing protein [Gammaproteobacteria bacterium]MBU2200449.1 DUF2306 domain-containing protein [Gammaproteobacteria bacterium]